MTIHLPKTQIEYLVSTSENPAEALLRLYKFVIPDLSDVVRMEGWPKVSWATWEFISQQFLDLGSRIGAKQKSPLMWMNSGFSVDHGQDVPDWQVSLSSCTITRENAA